MVLLTGIIGKVMFKRKIPGLKLWQERTLDLLIWGSSIAILAAALYGYLVKGHHG
jgi:hypothetical protein